MPTSTSSTLPVVQKSPQDYLDIVTWCQFFDSNSKQNQDRLKFKPYGVILKEKGFIHVIQLISTHVIVEKLHEWLGIKVGIAVLIKDYAAADVAAINLQWAPKPLQYLEVLR